MTNQQILNSLYEDIDISKSSQQIVDELLGIVIKQKETDKFKNTLIIPKGTKRQFEQFNQ